MIANCPAQQHDRQLFGSSACSPTVRLTSLLANCSAHQRVRQLFGSPVYSPTVWLISVFVNGSARQLTRQPFGSYLNRLIESLGSSPQQAHCLINRFITSIGVSPQSTSHHHDPIARAVSSRSHQVNATSTTVSRGRRQHRSITDTTSDSDVSKWDVLSAVTATSPSGMCQVH